MPKHFEYSVLLSSNPEEVFRILTDRRYTGNSKVLRDVGWKDGPPWQPGSTRIAETFVPFHSVHTQRVLARRDNELLEVISHGFGYTMHLEIVLRRASLTEGTEVDYLIDIEGKLPLLFGFVIEEFVSRFMEAYLAELIQVCHDPAVFLTSRDAA
jgi:hypothetical protein